MDVIKFDIPERLFLESSDFLADDDFLEIDEGVLGLDVLFLFSSLCGSCILDDGLLGDFLFVVVEVRESLHLMILDSVGLEGRELWIVQEVLKVAELMGLLIAIVVMFLVFQDGHFLVVVSIEEFINPADEREVKELRKLQHHDFSVSNIVFLEQMSQKHLDGLILVEFHSNSQSGTEVEIDLHNEILFT